jgi:Pyruvate/2-oxoacid:ferredoxin oxidoreductase delta subunit|tara:strand:+ start:1307 stop:2431 length:1125 start_codon:yes stop_codon:yes gene_type:complete
MTRQEQLQELFHNNQYFKMICGAGNEDTEEVRRLAMIYTLAGAKGLDISTTPDVVKAAMDGIDRAYDVSDKLGIDIGVRPYVMVSVGMPGDHHVRKAFIHEDMCVKCGLCVAPVCPTEAIEPIEIKVETAFVITEKCIGCGACSAVCPIVECITYSHNEKALEELLPQCIELGAENIELHAAVAETDVIMKEWEMVVKANPDGHNSMCLDRLHIGNFELKNRIEKALDMTKPGLMILQADGYPMSGGRNDFNTTLQAVATADVVNKQFNMRLNKKDKQLIYKRRRQLNVVLSGGTNSLTADLAVQGNVRFQGVAVGTFARNLIYKHIKDVYDYNDNGFYNDLNNIREAYLIGKELVDSNINKGESYGSNTYIRS